METQTSDALSNTFPAPVKRGRGRPKKSDIERFKKQPIGRPKNDTGRMQELKTRLLATSGERIIQKVLNIAYNDEHPSQMAALKLCWDRMLPLSMFEKDARGGRAAVTINIVGVDNTSISATPDDNTIDMEEVDG